MYTIFIIFGVFTLIYLLCMFMGDFLKDLFLVVSALLMLLLEETFVIVFANVKSEGSGTKLTCLVVTTLVCGFLLSALSTMVVESALCSILFGLTGGAILGVCNVQSDGGIDLEARRACPSP